MEFRHLAALCAVAEQGSISGAAVSMGYTQSAVSQQLAALERELEVPLLVRRGGSRPVVLTPAGQRTIEHATAILNRVDLLRSDCSRLQTGADRVVRVGTIGSTAVHLLPHVLRLLEQGHPTTEIQLTEERSDGPLLAAIERGGLDLCFAQLPLPSGPFEWRHLLTGTYVALVSAEQDLQSTNSADMLAEIARLPLIAYKRVRRAHDMEHYLIRLGFKPQVVYRTDDNGTVQRLVGAGLGAAIVPEIAIDPHDPATRVIRDLPHLPPFPICLAWHRDVVAPATFIDCATVAAKDLEGRLLAQ